MAPKKVRLVKGALHSKKGECTVDYVTASVASDCKTSPHCLYEGKGNDAVTPPPLIGRFGTSLKTGIVGLPNVG